MISASLRALLVAASLLGCATSTAPTPPLPTPAQEEAAVRTRVAELMARAAADEPAVTERLKGLAAEAGGEMVKLQYRLKTERSATRKLKLKLHARPGALASEITLQDMLRYTMRVDDDPAGRYVETVARTLAQLESEGHEVLKIKNYWPAGDNYSGVNSVLQAPSGLPWELQFHTTDSLKVQSETRPHYEELRREDTDLARKRVLFDEMTARWGKVRIPTDVLEAQNLHAREIIKRRPRP